MAWDEENETTIYKVVVNHEEQYSIWPADRENPLGWRDVGKSGPKAECLAYIEVVWTDMRSPCAASLCSGGYGGGPPRQTLGAGQSSPCRWATLGKECKSPEREYRSGVCTHQVYRNERWDGARRQA